MSAFMWRRDKPAGLPPGTLVYVGQYQSDKSNISRIDYDGHGLLREQKIDDMAGLADAASPDFVTWIDVAGLGQLDVVQQIGDTFGIHPLLLEDIVNTYQRPKIEFYDNYVYIILKMLRWHEPIGRLDVEQVSIVLGPHFVLSFQDFPQDVFDGLRQRLRDGKGRARRMGSDYLAYTMIDIIVDNYFVVLEKMGDVIEDLEEELVSDPSAETLQRIHGAKRQMLYLRKSIWPLREVVGRLHRGESELISADTDIYLRDVYEHTVQVIDTVETYRDIVSGLLDIYLSSVSNRLNEVMKLLTVIATLFIPLTFITSVYGMNFAYMPELQWRWGYFGVWGIIVAASSTMLLYFRRRGWL